MSRSDTRMIRDWILNYVNVIKFKEPTSQMSIVEAWVLMGVLGVIINDSCTCCCYLLSIVVYFMILFDVYCFLFWVGRWYLLSTCSLYWPLLVCFSLLFVECSKRTIDFDSSATLASLQHIRFQGELLFLARTGLFPSRLDVLKFGHGPSLYLF